MQPMSDGNPNFTTRLLWFSGSLIAVLSCVILNVLVPEVGEVIRQMAQRQSLSAASTSAPLPANTPVPAPTALATAIPATVAPEIAPTVVPTRAPISLPAPATADTGVIQAIYLLIAALALILAVALVVTSRKSPQRPAAKRSITIPHNQAAPVPAAQASTAQFFEANKTAQGSAEVARTLRRLALMEVERAPRKRARKVQQAKTARPDTPAGPPKPSRQPASGMTSRTRAKTSSGHTPVYRRISRRTNSRTSSATNGKHPD